MSREQKPIGQRPLNLLAQYASAAESRRNWLASSESLSANEVGVTEHDQSSSRRQPTNFLAQATVSNERQRNLLAPTEVVPRNALLTHLGPGQFEPPATHANTIRQATNADLVLEVRKVRLGQDALKEAVRELSVSRIAETLEVEARRAEKNIARPIVPEQKRRSVRELIASILADFAELWQRVRGK